ncbi:MAG: SH3 domain-containing protein [Candidatus Krumholzibacteriota bacterium]|nr:SH3 domain-containing protein [Candidatus Krumholzibacteriota bacterium]
MTIDMPTMTDEPTAGEYARINDQVRALLDFKKHNVKGRNKTPCPECATHVGINANKCPQCASDIADHTSNVRARLAQLDKITTELDQLHSKYMEYRGEEAAMQPIVERVRRIISAPQMAAGIKTVLPSFLLFFAFIATLRIIGNGPLFWAGSLAGGFVAYSLLKKSAFKYYVTVELYRAALIVGLIVMMSGAAAAPLSGWSMSMFSTNRVEVVRPVVNVRESATTDSRIVATANNGDKLTVIEKRGAWYNVKTSDGQTGWVHSSLVKD